MQPKNNFFGPFFEAPLLFYLIFFLKMSSIYSAPLFDAINPKSPIKRKSILRERTAVKMNGYVGPANLLGLKITTRNFIVHS